MRAALAILALLLFPAMANASVTLQPVGPLKGIVFEIHGGGWLDSPAMTQAGADFEKRWTEDGWAVYAPDYTPQAGALTSILATYDWYMGYVPTNVPVVVMGQSAGGQLALMLASLRSNMAAVIVEGAPTDLSKSFQDNNFTENYINAAFPTPTEKHYNSPVNFTLKISADKVLYGRAACDPYVPVEQMDQYVALHPGVTTFQVPCEHDQAKWTPGTLFTHAYVTAAGMCSWRMLEGSFAGL